LEYYNNIRKYNRIERIELEIKSTTKEKNLALLKRRFFEELYGYLKYTINPSDSWFMPTSIVGKYGSSGKVVGEKNNLLN